MDPSIKGKIVWVEGNQMPQVIPEGVDVDSFTMAAPSPKGVVRTLYVFPLTKQQDVKREGEFFKNIPHDPIATVTSDEKGEFDLALPAGNYSLMVEEKKGMFFANIFDGKGNINPIKVVQDQVTQVEFVINYRASY
ncbi:MAG: carboxypeptidase-like regulatory domain-containing protein [Cyclobacteriaceae bacterium]|nr:hypothetical protein [Cyclobacteriaceae bacterium]MCH8517043.1 carboxypeptidase-like regulatory domain-containing protein [Cyclobacteriaceae bacterium]